MDADDVAYDVGYDMLMMVGQCLYMSKLQKKWKNKKLKKINKEKIQTTYIYIYIHIFNKKQPQIPNTKICCDTMFHVHYLHI